MGRIFKDAFDLGGVVYCISLTSSLDFLPREIDAAGDFDIFLLGVFACEDKISSKEASDFDALTGFISSAQMFSFPNIVNGEVSGDAFEISGLLDFLPALSISLPDGEVDVAAIFDTLSFKISLCETLGSAGKNFGGRSGFESLARGIPLMSSLCLPVLFSCGIDGAGSLAT